jgi:hypothetical protein
VPTGADAGTTRGQEAIIPRRHARRLQTGCKATRAR